MGWFIGSKYERGDFENEKIHQDGEEPKRKRVNRGAKKNDLNILAPVAKVRLLELWKCDKAGIARRKVCQACFSK